MAPSPEIRLARVLEWRDDPGDHPAYLVDRLWPRGVRKDSLAVAGWPKSLTPSTELRKDLHGGRIDFTQFTRRYEAQLDALGSPADWPGDAQPLRADVARGAVTLLYAAKDGPPNHASVLRDWLRRTMR